MHVLASALVAAAALTAARTAGPVHAARSLPPLVVVDPGHGGKDGGAMHGGVREEAINLEAARALAAALKARGYRVLLTRDIGCREAVAAAAGTDMAADRDCRVNLRDRVLRAAYRRASVFLSVHCDHYVLPSVHGPRTYYGRGSELQRELAVSVQRQLDAFRDRPFRPMASDHFVLLAQPQVPAVTVELGFLTNPRERRLLSTAAYRRQLAEAVARGVDDFARVHPLMPPPSVDVAGVEHLWQVARGRAHAAARGGAGGGA